MGVVVVECYIMLDCMMWGFDYVVLFELIGLEYLVCDIWVIECVVGDGVKCVFESE